MASVGRAPGKNAVRPAEIDSSLRGRQRKMRDVNETLGVFGLRRDGRRRSARNLGDAKYRIEGAGEIVERYTENHSQPATVAGSGFNAVFAPG